MLRFSIKGLCSYVALLYKGSLFRRSRSPKDGREARANLEAAALAEKFKHLHDMLDAAATSRSKSKLRREKTKLKRKTSSRPSRRLRSLKTGKAKLTMKAAIDHSVAKAATKNTTENPKYLST